MHELRGSSTSRGVRKHRVPRDQQKGGGRIPVIKGLGRIAVILRVPSTVGFGSNSGHGQWRSLSVYYGSESPLLDRFGMSTFPGQYIVLRFVGTGRDSVSHALGIHVLRDSRATPKKVEPRARRSERRTRDMQRQRIRSAPGQDDSARAAYSGLDAAAPAQWIHLKNLSLRPGRNTDFQMTIADDAGDILSRSQVQVQP